MTDTTFVDQTTVIEADWCNDVNDHVYNSTPVSPATTVHPASVIANTPAGGIVATTVQAAIDELDTEKATVVALNAHINDTTDAHAASAITNTPAGGIGATTVQAAINELDTDKAPLAGALTQNFMAKNFLAAETYALGTTDPSTGYNIPTTYSVPTPATTEFGFNTAQIFSSTCTANGVGYRANPRTAVASFTLTDLINYLSGGFTLGAGSAVTNYYGFYSADETNATNHYGFYSNISNAANKWNFYAAGTAPNHFVGGLTVGASKTNGEIYSGTYTPTLTGVANVAASTAFVCQYMRVDQVVTVSGIVSIDPTAGATLTQLGVSLPIASNFGAGYQVGGSITTAGVTSGESGSLAADATNNRAQIDVVPAGAGNITYSFCFTYLIV